MNFREHGKLRTSTATTTTKMRAMRTMTPSFFGEEEYQEGKEHREEDQEQEEKEL